MVKRHAVSICNPARVSMSWKSLVDGKYGCYAFQLLLTDGQNGSSGSIKEERFVLGYDGVSRYD